MIIRLIIGIMVMVIFIFVTAYILYDVFQPQIEKADQKINKICENWTDFKNGSRICEKYSEAKKVIEYG